VTEYGTRSETARIIEAFFSEKSLMHHYFREAGQAAFFGLENARLNSIPLRGAIMRCSRCGGRISGAAVRCPNCKLPKSKAGAIPYKSRQEGKRGIPKWVTMTGGIAAFMLAIGVGFYLVSYLTEKPLELDPNLSQPALAKLRHSPSTQSGLSVDEYMSGQLEKSRRVGNLLKYQGWTVGPIKGSKTKLLIAFSYEERDNTQYRAEWVADVASDTFTPQNELAISAYKK
jgi:hypothetical protein